MSKISIIKQTIKSLRLNRREYNIYFFTLSLGILLFYLFITILNWNILTSDSENEIIINIFSGFIIILAIIIMGFLFEYANRFMIKRRAKEISIYMLLGMDVKKIKAKFATESVILGSMALITGIISGHAIVWGIIIWLRRSGSLLYGEIGISFNSFWKTLLYFSFLLIILIKVNNQMIDNSSIKELMNKEKINECDSKINIVVQIITLFCSVGLLLKASSIGEELAGNFKLSVLILNGAAGIVGIFLFYYSFVEVMMKAIKSLKKIYYKKYNVFICNQLKKNLHTNYISMSIISIGLIFSACGFFISAFFYNDFLMLKKEKSNYDATMMFHDSQEVNSREVYETYKTNLGDNVYSSVLEVIEFENIDEFFDCDSDMGNISCHKMIRLSEYNNTRRMLGYEELSLSNDEYVICSEYQFNSQNQQAIGKNMTILDKKFSYFGDTLLSDNICNSDTSVDTNVIILSDSNINEIIGKNQEYHSMYFINTIYNSENAAQLVKDYTKSLVNNKVDVTLFTKVDVDINVKIDEFKFGIILIGLFWGCVFLMVACTILSLHEVSQTYESTNKYSILYKIGLKKKEVYQILAVQMAIIFLVPFLFAVFFSIIILSGLFNNTYIENIKGIIAGVMFLYTAFYFNYYIFTFNNCKHIVSTELAGGKK